MLFARVGEPRCPEHDLPLAAQTISEMVDKATAFPEGTKLMVLAPVVQERKGEHIKTLEGLAAQGYVRARIDGEISSTYNPRRTTNTKNIPLKWW
ncbi:UvrABC system protein A [Alishewanella longhuensis]